VENLKIIKKTKARKENSCGITIVVRGLFMAKIPSNKRNHYEYDKL
jgi:hypothetical protein